MPERFSASVASKHIACHASANLELAIPGWTPPADEGSTVASSKGTDMHSVLEAAAVFSPREMQGLAEAMAYVAELRRKRRFTREVEAQGTGWWLTSKPHTRADLLLYTQDELHVVDYKFGRILVDPIGNSQGMYYSLAFLDRAPKAKGVHFHIVQPFVDNISSVFFTLNELDQFRLDCIAAETAVNAGSVTFTPNDHCTFCPANPHSRSAKGSPLCPAMMQLLYPHTQIDEDSILDSLT